MADSNRRQKVVVVGAGPVGALAALYAAQRGDDVEIYELRGDLRNSSTVPLNFTKSINLALSERGINSMREAKRDGLLESILDSTIPMHGRMVHGRNRLGEIHEESQAYDVHDRAILAVDRSGLNIKLLDSLESLTNVKFFFNHKLTGADLKNQKAWFEKRSVETDRTRASSTVKSEAHRDPEVEVEFDLLIGADGAHSATRHHLMKYARLNYRQEYIDTLWCEFHIQPNDQDFAISPNHLHIWPGGSFMFIAIPSLDRSFTCTLFASQAIFDHMEQLSENVPKFFDQHFPGVSPDLISRENLVKQFAESPHLPLISIKCRPYHFRSSAVILGDAAHAMVPFYGQGMNAGLEDVRVLFEFLDEHGVYRAADTNTRKVSRATALEFYTNHRAPDASAINELALRNYHEMSSAVTSPLYLVRKFIEEGLSKYLPALGWSTQYSRVSFGNDRYSEIEKTTKWQGTALFAGMAVLQLGLLGVAGFSWLKWHRSNSNGFFVRLLRA